MNTTMQSTQICYQDTVQAKIYTTSEIQNLFARGIAEKEISDTRSLTIAQKAEHYEIPYYESPLFI